MQIFENKQPWQIITKGPNTLSALPTRTVSALNRDHKLYMIPDLETDSGEESSASSTTSHFMASTILVAWQ